MGNAASGRPGKQNGGGGGGGTQGASGTGKCTLEEPGWGREHGSDCTSLSLTCELFPSLLRELPKACFSQVLSSTAPPSPRVDRPLPLRDAQSLHRARVPVFLSVTKAAPEWAGETLSLQV